MCLCLAGNLHQNMTLSTTMQNGVQPTLFCRLIEEHSLNVSLKLGIFMLAQSHLDDSFQNRIKTEGQHQTNDNRQDGRPGLAINVGTIWHCR